MLPAVASRAAQLRQEREDAEMLLELLEAHKPEYFKANIVRENLPENRVLYVSTVMGHIEASGLDVIKVMPATPVPPLDRNSNEGQIALRNYGTLYSFYTARETALNFFTTATSQISQDTSAAALDLIGRFSRSVENNSEG